MEASAVVFCFNLPSTCCVYHTESDFQWHISNISPLSLVSLKCQFTLWSSLIDCGHYLFKQLRPQFPYTDFFIGCLNKSNAGTPYHIAASLTSVQVTQSLEKGAGKFALTSCSRQMILMWPGTKRKINELLKASKHCRTTDISFICCLRWPYLNLGLSPTNSLLVSL